jgi:hypothetical protein
VDAPGGSLELPHGDLLTSGKVRAANGDGIGPVPGLSAAWLLRTTSSGTIIDQRRFATEGMHKHSVAMQTPWPLGLYHTVFQFLDGSTKSRSFTAAEP